MRLRLLVLIFLLPACASSSAQREATSSIFITDKPSSTAQTDAQIVFQFERSGGFAGLNDHWTLYEDGSFISTTGDAYVFPPEEIIKLVELTMSLNLLDAQTPARPFNSCADCFRYTLFVNKGGIDYELVWRDGDETIPDALISILNAINSLILKASQN